MSSFAHLLNPVSESSGHYHETYPASPVLSLSSPDLRNAAGVSTGTCDDAQRPSPHPMPCIQVPYQDLAGVSLSSASHVPLGSTDAARVSTQDAPPPSPLLMSSIPSAISTSFLPTDYIAQAPTHAGRHPDSLVQISRINPGISDAQKATRKVQQEASRVDKEAFSDAFSVFLEKRYEDLVAFAGAHNRKVEHIEKLLNTSSHYKPKRAVNLQNAKIHAKAAEVNEGRAPGDCAKISEIRRLVKEDTALQNLSKEQEQILKNSVNDLRDLRKNGARPSNKASAMDYRTEVKDLNDRICSLSQRTGAAVIAFFTRTNLDDVYEPSWICTPGAMDFSKDTLKFSMWDICRLFEQWSCSKAKTIRNKDTLPAMREECSGIINGALRTVTRCNTAVMNYINYDIQIMQRYQVKLVGYTYSEFISPYNISVVDDLRVLRDALQCGSCCWIRMTKGEVSRHAADIAKREAAGEVVTTKRKQRSDKGVKRGKRAAIEVDGGDDESDVNNENDGLDGAGPSKRQKVSAKVAKQTVAKKTPATKKSSGGRKKAPAKSQLPPSNEFINSEDDLTA